MKQDKFERLHEAGWAEFAAWLTWRQARQRGTAPFAAHELPQRYRQLCHHLALARDRDYGLALVERLHALAQRGHDALYRERSGALRRVLRYAAGGFAADVRRRAGWVVAAALLLFLPLIAMALAIRVSPGFAFHLLSPAEIAQMEAMYDPAAQALGRTARQADMDVEMFGFYIFNNVSIAFRCYAGGLTAGLGTVWTLLINGLMIGTIEARLVYAGFAESFYSFVAGHTAFELGAFVLSGACGLQLAAALIAPGRRTRASALRETARGQIGMVCGLAAMLVAAALVEAFWSPLRFALPVKLAVGASLLLLTLLYFLLAGRDDGS